MVVASVHAQDNPTSFPTSRRFPPPKKLDNERLAANGIRQIVGKHLTLYTDIRARADVDELTTVFDAAVPQWCAYFSIDPSLAESWQMRAYVIQDRQRFQSAGLMPTDLPDFLAGYQRGSEMWIYEQPGNYYTRHLLLHEGTHATMDRFLKGLGAPWYAEGMAELLGLHHWSNHSANSESILKLNYRPTDRNETEYWGRVKIIRDEVQAGTAMSLDDVLNIPATAFRDVRSYAWAWAGCDFLSQHPLSRAAFQELIKNVADGSPRFHQSFRKSLQSDWPALERDWQLFLDEMDYGIEVQKIVLQPATVWSSEKGTEHIEMEAVHAWQTTIAVKRGQRYRLTCDSRFQIGNTAAREGENDQPWPCEADGITLEYYRSQPIGLLLAGTIATESKSIEENPVSIPPDASIAGLLKPITIGRSSEIEIAEDGLLCLRINESPAKMGDNEGVLKVTVEKLE